VSLGASASTPRSTSWLGDEEANQTVERGVSLLERHDILPPISRGTSGSLERVNLDLRSRPVKWWTLIGESPGPLTLESF
ncbi:MAG: hypothetical protein ABR585_14530, partial [Gemmatimonadaceae bacterium]